MSGISITKLEAARRQLEDALQSYFKGGDILAINTKAHAAFQVLFDICTTQHGAKIAVRTIVNRIGKRKFNRVAEFLRHANWHRDDVLTDDPAGSAYMYLLFAIALYRANGGALTADMLAFEQEPDPFKDGYLHKATVEFFRQHRDHLATLSDERRGELEGITTKPSTTDIIKE